MPQTLLISRRTALTAAAVVLASPCRAFAQSAVPAEFPKRPMTLILPLAPGGPVDVLGRLLAQEYQARSGHPAGVENRTGGAGNIGIDAVRRATPDGTTLLVIPAGNLTINPTLMSDLTSWYGLLAPRDPQAGARRHLRADARHPRVAGAA